MQEDTIQPEPESNIETISGPAGLKGIDTLKDMQFMSMVMGFDEGFDSMGKEAEDVYKWAKEATGIAGGPELIAAIKEVVEFTGMSGRGRDLLRKVHRWTRLDTSIKSLRKSQKVIENV